MMRIVSDYGLVRIVHLGDPFNNAYDILVESRDSIDSEWTLFHGFNTLSDDYAYTNSREAAARAIKQVAARVANKIQGVAN
jgi:hypothetical protein